jgi:TP901-1 family phage major tail protein
MSTATKGVDLLISIGGVVLGCQRGASLTRSADTIDVTCKDVEWKQFISSVRDWSISADGMYIFDDTALLALETAFSDGEPVTVTISNKNYTGGTSGEFIGWTGSGTITSFPIDAPYDDAVTYSLEIQGSGELLPVYDGTVAVTSIVTLPATLALTVGQISSPLTTTITPANASNTALTYTSSAPTKAVVTAEGRVVGISAGSATITVTATGGSGVTDTVAVTVS